MFEYFILNDFRFHLIFNFKEKKKKALITFSSFLYLQETTKNSLKSFRFYNGMANTENLNKKIYFSSNTLNEFI